MLRTFLMDLDALLGHLVDALIQVHRTGDGWYYRLSINFLHVLCLLVSTTQMPSNEMKTKDKSEGQEGQHSSMHMNHMHKALADWLCAPGFVSVRIRSFIKMKNR